MKKFNLNIHLWREKEKNRWRKNLCFHVDVFIIKIMGGDDQHTGLTRPVAMVTRNLLSADSDEMLKYELQYEKHILCQTVFECVTRRRFCVRTSPAAFLGGGCMFFLCLHGFSPGPSASSHRLLRINGILDGRLRSNCDSGFRPLRDM